MGTVAAAYFALVGVLSLVSFAAYGFDKRRAGTDRRRIPERTFYALAFLGGWPGGVAGQRYFRHKTRKFTFLAAFWAFTVFHVGLAAAVAYRLSRPAATEAAETARPIDPP